MKNLMALGAIALVVSASVADDVFPNADGSGNLLSADAWGGAVSFNRMKIGSGGTYFAGTNGTINGLLINTTGKVTFDQTKSSEANPLVKMGAHFDIGGTGRKVTFKGGTYDFQNSYRFTYGGYDSYKNNQVVFDGCVMTNVSGPVSMTYNGTVLSEWTLTNNAAIYTGGDLKPDYFGNGVTHLYIKGGSQLVAGGILQMGARNEGNVGKVDQKIYVSGEGSLLKFGSNSSVSVLSMQFEGALLEVSEGGHVTNAGSKEFVVGQKASASNNVIRAKGAGTVASLGSLNFGYSSTASYNRIEALDDATVTSSYITFKDGTDNGFVCSNATVTITQYDITGGTNVYFRISGDHPKVQLSADSKKYSLKRGTRLIFDLPAAGYNYQDPADCPLVAYAGNTDAVDDMTVLEINGIEECQKWMVAHRVRNRKIKLAYLNCNSYWGHISSERLARWNAALPEGAVLSSPNTSGASDRGRTLYLTLEAKFGTLVIFR